MKAGKNDGGKLSKLIKNERNSLWSMKLKANADKNKHKRSIN